MSGETNFCDAAKLARKQAKASRRVAWGSILRKKVPENGHFSGLSVTPISYNDNVVVTSPVRQASDAFGGCGAARTAGDDQDPRRVPGHCGPCAAARPGCREAAGGGGRRGTAGVVVEDAAGQASGRC